MAGNDWLREERGEVAVDKLLDAAAEAFTDLGVKATTMADVCTYAGCSRATLYRYFENRRALHLGFVNRAALRLSAEIAARTASITDTQERVVRSILESVRAVRADPSLSVWFTAEDMSIATELSQNSEMLDPLVAQFLGASAPPSAGEASEVRLRARWMVRIIISLLTMPGADEEEEREMVSRFMAPPLLGEPSTV